MASERGAMQVGELETSSHMTTPVHQEGRTRPRALQRQGEKASSSVLVVADKEDSASAIERALQAAGYTVKTVTGTGRALELVLESSGHDLVVLDGAGLAGRQSELLGTLREWKVQAPVILLLERNSVIEKVAGLDAGADDVMIKPLAVEELQARARALLRRPSVSREPVLRLSDLTLDPVTREVKRGGRCITLTPKEYSLLEYLLQNVGRVVTRCMILERVWGLNFDPESNLVDVYAGYLRRKIETADRPRLLHSVRGVGYVFGMEP
jgi:DNA-binding response OmpR family regulator